MSLAEMEAKIRAVQAQLEAVTDRAAREELKLAAIECALLPQDASERARRCKLLLEQWGLYG